MEFCVASRVITRNTSPVRGFAHLAYLLIALTWNQGKAVCRLELLGVSKLDLWVPDRAVDMNPVVGDRPLQWFTWTDRFSCSFLLLLIPLDDFCN
jgi:hypothetical protein